MSRATEATTDLICALIDGAGEIDSTYYRQHAAERLETTARAVADLLTLVYPEIDNVHRQRGGTVPGLVT